MYELSINLYGTHYGLKDDIILLSSFQNVLLYCRKQVCIPKIENMDVKLLVHYAKLIEINKEIILQQSLVEAEKGSIRTIEIAIEKKRKKAEVIELAEKIEKAFPLYLPDIENKRDPSDEDIINICEATQKLLKDEKQPKLPVHLDDQKEVSRVEKIDYEGPKDQIQKYIKLNKIDSAFSILDQNPQPHVQEEVYLLMSRWARLKESEISGNIRAEEYRVECNNIIAGLYKIAEILETEGTKK